jgi:mono/diheme cytochrome c family protein
MYEHSSARSLADRITMLKKLLIGLALLALIVVIGVPGYLYAAFPKTRPAPAMTAPRTPEAIARGKYLSEGMTGCIACHSPIDESRPGDFPQSGLEYAGRVFGRDAGFPGIIVAPNLTPDPDTGIGRWTDGEVVRAIREGVSRDGRPLFPFMNYGSYRAFSDEDVLAIVAYLRTQTPVRRDNGTTVLDFPVGMMIRTAPRPLDGPAAGLPPAGVERGRALLQITMCGECHTPRDDRGNPLPGRDLVGGNPFPGPWGVVYSANITSHPAAGIGAFSPDDLKRVFREGKNRAGRDLWVMPWSITKNMSDADLDALIAALREVPPSANLVPAPRLTR